MNVSGLFCSRCGAMNDVQAAFCIKCGAPQQQTGAASTSVPTQQLPPSPEPNAYVAQPGPAYAVAPAYEQPMYQAAVPPVTYAGFWIRFLAYIIDCALMSIVTMPLMFIFVGMGAAGANSRNPEAAAMAMLTMLPILMLVSFVGGWLYFALMESSSKQGTVGKMVLKLRVTDMQGNRISFGRATGRFFAKLINSFTLLIGWIIAGFTARKQALHDFIAGTVVLKTNV